MLHLNRIRLFLSLCGLIAGCASPAGESSSDDRFDIELDRAVMNQSAPQQAAWTHYALARIKAYEELESRRRNTAAEDYLIELRARTALAEFWRNEQGKPGVPRDAYLDRLVEIDAASELEEHVLAALFQPGWTIPAAELARIDFGGLEHALPRDQTPTLATARPRSGNLQSRIPGFDLPDPIPLQPSRIPCTESLPILRKTLAGWEREEEALDGAPAPANSDGGFLALIEASHSQAPFLTRGATWVSPRIYGLLFIAGFCAVEIENYPQAERWLASAVAMAPAMATARMELAHALVSQRKLEQADAIIDPILLHSQDRCELARGWRRRGYIRFEQRRLDEARSAYLRSLEFDPNSELARSELDLLKRTIVENGGHPDWYVPPPSKTQVTVCSDA